MALSINKFHSCDEAHSQAGAKIENLLSDSSILLVSGGSSLKALNYVNNIPSGLVVGLIDERYTANINDTNWNEFSKTDFFKKAENTGAEFVTVPFNANHNVLDTGNMYHDILNSLFQRNIYSKVIGLFGIGEDGHTAGIFPFPENLDFFNNTFFGPHLAVGYDAKDKNKFNERVTTTFSMMRERLTHGIFIACGKNKKKSVSKTLEKDGDLAETPARIIHELTQADLFTDIDL